MNHSSNQQQTANNVKVKGSNLVNASIKRKRDREIPTKEDGESKALEVVQDDGEEKFTFEIYADGKPRISPEVVQWSLKRLLYYLHQHKVKVKRSNLVNAFVKRRYSPGEKVGSGILRFVSLIQTMWA